MAEVDTITVKDAAGVSREVPTILSLEALIATLIGHVDGLEAALSAQAGYLDGIEALLGTSNTSLALLAPILPATPVDLAFNNTSAQSAAITATRVRLIAKTADCRVLFGSNPTALSTSMLIVAGSSEYFAFTSGHKIAAIRDAAVDGTLNITPAT